MRLEIFKDEIYLPEPVGKQPKYWLKSYGKRFLFKLATACCTNESVST